MGKTSSAVKNRYNAKAYDQLPIRVPKGRKQAVEAHARKKGESVNGLVNALLRADMGITEEEWKTVRDESWDSDFTKVTPAEAAALEAAEAEIAHGETISDSEIDWGAD